MKKLICSNNYIMTQRKKYLFLMIILGIGIISGILFVFMLSKKDATSIKEHYEVIFNSISNKNINSIKTFINSISSNLLSIVVMYLLSISIIGIPITILSAEAFVRAYPQTAKYVGDLHIVKVIVVPGKIVNVVIK